MKDIIALFDNQKVFIRKGIPYLDLPFFNHSIPTSPKILKKVVKRIAREVDWNKQHVNLLVSEEEYGGFLTACLSMEIDIPFTLAKQDKIHSINGINITFPMDYNQKMTLSLNGIKKNDRVVIVDDIIASGGTLIALIKAIQKAKAEIVAVIVLAEKVNLQGVKKVQKETGHNVKTLIRLDVSKKRTKVIETSL